MNKWTKLCFLILGGGTIFKLSSMKDVFYVPMQHDWGYLIHRLVLASLFMQLFKQSDYFHHCILPIVSLRKFYCLQD